MTHEELHRVRGVYEHAAVIRLNADKTAPRIWMTPVGILRLRFDRCWIGTWQEHLGLLGEMPGEFDLESIAQSNEAAELLSESAEVIVPEGIMQIYDE